MIGSPSASYSLIVRVEIVNRPGMLGKVTSAIGKAGGDIGAIDLVEVGKSTVTRDISFKASDEKHGEQVVDKIRGVGGVRVINVSDRTFLMHLGGKIEVKSKMALKTRDDLSMAYTPGVARVCMAIHADPEKAYSLTIKQNCVAVVTDGTAVLGLGAPGGHAGHGRQGPPLQGAGQRRRLPALPRHQGCRRDRDARQGGVARVRRDQPGGYLGAALL